jgi:flagellar basal-body rod protein FlgB
MLLRLFNTTALSTAEQALSGLSRRQESIASNIANIDTPGYQRKEVSFEDSLRSMLTDEAVPEVTLGRTDAQHMAIGDEGGGLGIGSTGGGGSPRDIVSARNDANTVGVDEEMTRLVETQMRYQALSQSLGSRISTLRTVIRGQ